MSTIKTPSVLAFERKLDPSDALFYAGKWSNRKDAQSWSAITIMEKSVRGTISNRLKTKDVDPAKLDAEIEKANLQKVDVAALPADCDTLKLRFTLKILSNIGQASACNNLAYQHKLTEVVKAYVTQNGFKELANRYALNLANGRFLWRNRIGAENIEITINCRQGGDKLSTFCFNAHDFSLRDFKKDQSAKADVTALSQIIEAGLKGEAHVLLNVEAFVRVGEGQEVFPSQELIIDSRKSKKGAKSKTLYQVNGIAAMHSQKIGNAIRTIDTWYAEDASTGPIAIEPYGSVTSQGKAYRPEKTNFYTLFDNWLIKDRVPDINDQHFVIATIIRGGVFGASSKE